MKQQHYSSEGLKRITTGAVMAAVIFFATWLIRIPVPISGGAYINFGDTAIFLCAYIAGGPLSAAAAALGSGLADLAAGAAVYILPTMGIKALMALCAGRLMKKRTFSAYLGACLAGSGIMAAGYFAFETVLLGVAPAAVSLPFNLLQAGGSTLASCLLFDVARRLAREERRRRKL